jgi:hypothetical protein
VRAEVQARLAEETEAREEAERRVWAEVEARLKAETEARDKAEEVARLVGELKTREAETEAKARAETEIRLKAEEVERLMAELKAREEAEARVKAETASKVSEKSENAAIYARVPLEDQRADLSRQMAKAVRYANLHKIKVGTTVTEIGSRHLPKLMKLLQNSQIKVIVVERRNCLTGFEYIEAALSAEGRRLIAMSS